MVLQAGGQWVIIINRSSHCDVLQSFKILTLSPLKFTHSQTLSGVLFRSYFSLMPFYQHFRCLKQQILVAIIIQSDRKGSRRRRSSLTEGSDILLHNTNNHHSFPFRKLHTSSHGIHQSKMSRAPFFLLYCSAIMHWCSAFARPIDQFSFSLYNVFPLPQRTMMERGHLLNIM